MKRLIPVFLLIFGYGFHVSAQNCGAGGCNTLTPEDLHSTLALWPHQGPDCNNDGSSNLLDMVCLLNTIPDLDAPELQPIAEQVVRFDQTLSFTLSASDPNGDPIVFGVVNPPENAGLNSDTGQFTFTPAIHQTGAIAVRFYAYDGFLYAWRDAVIRVTGDLEAEDQNLTTEEDTALPVTLTALSPLGPTTFSIDAPPLHGTLRGVEDQLIYTPNRDYFGPDQFVYSVNDGVSTDHGVISLDIMGVNDPPLAHVARYGVGVNQETELVLTGEDADQDPLTFNIIEGPVHGVLTGHEPPFLYTPDPDFSGQDSFSFQAHDGQTAGDTVEAHIVTTPPAPILDPWPTHSTSPLLTMSGDATGHWVRISGSGETVTVPVTGGRFSVDLSLNPNEKHRFYFTAIMDDVHGAPAAATVIYDTEAPVIIPQFPQPGEVIHGSTVDVSGKVMDAGGHVAEIRVNGALAQQLPGGAFLAPGISLTPNALHTLEVVATDHSGNSASYPIVVRSASPSPDKPRMTMISGNGQTASISTRLAQPFEVRITHGDGTPFPLKSVHFKVTVGSGGMASGLTDPVSRYYQVRADNDGRAIAWLHLGDAAGVHRVEAFSEDVAGRAFFYATATPGQALRISPAKHNHQSQEAGAPARRPLTVRVDDGYNGVAGETVTFRVTSQDGLVNGARTATAVTDAWGFASVNFHQGARSGLNRVEADFDGNGNPPARFSLYGPLRYETVETSVSGVLLDDADRAIGGARCTLTVDGTTLETVSDASGVFTFLQPPQGPAVLHVDGGTANLLDKLAVAPNSFPTWSAPMVIIPHTANTLGAPIRLAQSIPAHKVNVFNDEDFALLLPDMEGFALEVKAGSVSVNGEAVHPFNSVTFYPARVQTEDLPVPPSSAAPVFSWRIHPTNATFDPPMTVRLPNTDGLAPGAQVNFYRYNPETRECDVAAFGAVSMDGSAIVTEPDSGLTRSGWFFAAPPRSGNAAITSSDCSDNPAPLRALAHDFNEAGLTLAATFLNHFLDGDGQDFHHAPGDPLVDELLDHEALTTVLQEVEQDLIHRIEGAGPSASSLDDYVFVTSQVPFSAPMPLTPGDPLTAALGVFPEARVTVRHIQWTGDQYTATAEIEAASPYSFLNDHRQGGPNRLARCLEMNGTARAFINHFSFSRDLSGQLSQALLPLSSSSNSPPTPQLGGWLDQTFQFSAGGHRAVMRSDGGFDIHHLPVADGPAPYVRITGVSHAYGAPIWVYSNPIHLEANQTASPDLFTYSLLPPPLPHALSLTGPQEMEVGQIMTLAATASMISGATEDVTPASAWTTYRSSRPEIAEVDENGRVTAVAPGQVMITAVNERAAATHAINITQTWALREVEGFVFHGDLPAAGVELRLSSGESTTTGAQGFFTLSVQAPLNEGVTLRASAFIDSQDWYAGPVALSLDHEVIDAGILHLKSGRDDDGDGLTNQVEHQLGLNAANPDSDNNGIPDGEEDTDGDGLTNLEETALGYHPGVDDTDGDGTPDGAEDLDGDGLSNEAELAAGLDPQSFDSDGDGLNDGFELYYGLDPLNGGDGTGDADGDGLTNLEEAQQDTDPFNPDRQAPALETMKPTPGSVDVIATHAIVLRFNEPVRRQGHIRVYPDGGQDVGGQLQFSSDPHFLVFQPDAPLNINTFYRVEVQDVRDTAGNRTAPFTLHFNTGPVSDHQSPSVLETSPPRFQTALPLNTLITFWFNEPVNPATVTSQNFFIVNNQETHPTRIFIDADCRSVSLAPTRPLKPNTSYSVNAANIQDMNGNIQESAFLHFTTGYHQNHEPLVLESAHPADEEAQIPTNGVLMLAFSKPVNPASFAQGFTLQRSGSPVDYQTSWSDGSRRVVITPTQSFTANTPYFFSVSHTIEDLMGNSLDADLNRSFTTGSGPLSYGSHLESMIPGNYSLEPVSTRGVLRFRTKIIPASVTGLTAYFEIRGTYEPIPVEVALTGDQTTLTVTPLEHLLPGTEYSLIVNGVLNYRGYAPYLSTRFTTEAGPDHQGPVVTAATPPHNQSGVPLNAILRIQFNETITRTAPATSPVLSLDGNPVPGHEAIEGRQLLFTPDQPLNAEATYQLDVRDLSDSSGNPSQPFLSSFTTGAESDHTTPEVTSVLPAPDAVSVPLETPIRLTFSESVDPTTVTPQTVEVWEFSNTLLAGELTVSGSEVVFTPIPSEGRTPPANTTVRIQVSGVRDLAGNQAPFFQSSYQVGNDPDTVRPRVLSVTPEDGAEGVGPNQWITLLFSESIDRFTLNPQNLALMVDNQVLSTDVYYSNDRRHITLVANLPEESVITVVVTDGVKDLTGNRALPFTSSFTTRTFQDTSTMVTAIRPKGARLAPNGPITLFFNGPIDPDTLDTGVAVEIDDVPVPGFIHALAQNMAVQFTPDEAWPLDRSIAVKVSSRLLDVNGKPVRSFTDYISSQLDVSQRRPTVSSFNMMNGEPVNVVLELYCSEPLDPATVNEEAIHLTLDGAPAPITVSLHRDNRLIRITPNQDLEPNSPYRLSIDNGAVTDLQGEFMWSWGRTFTTGEGQVTAPPAVSRVSPAHGTRNVPVNAAIQLLFNQPVNSHTLNPDTVTLTSNGHQISRLIFTFRDNAFVSVLPAEPLPENAEVHVHVDGVTGVTGAPAPPYSFSFSTGEALDQQRPQILNFSHDGETSVGLNAVLLAAYNEPLALASVNRHTVVLYDNDNQNVPTTLSLSNDGKWIRIVPHEPLRLQNRHTLFFTGVTDLAGNTHSNTFYFTTGLDPDLEPPVLLAAHPTTGATEVPLNVVLETTFNEPVTLGHVSLSTDGAAVPVSIYQRYNTESWQFTPELPLEPNTEYQLVLSSVTDRSGNLMVDPPVLHFTTDDRPLLGAPVLLRRDPSHLETIARNGKMHLRFSQPINPLSIHRLQVAHYVGYDAILVPATPVLSEDRRGLTLIFDQPLEPNQDYAFTYNNLENDAGMTTGYGNIHFSSGDQTDETTPEAIVVSPGRDAVDAPVNSLVHIRFNKRMAFASVSEGDGVLTANGQPVPGELSFQSDPDFEDHFRVLRFQPHSHLAPNTTYTFTLNHITDMAGRALSESFSFTTGEDVDTERPTLQNMDPANGATGVNLEQTVVMTFDEPLDPTTVTPRTIWVALSPSDQNHMPGDFTVQGDEVRFTPIPAAMRALPPNTVVYVIITNRVADLAGNSASHRQYSFTSGDFSDNIPPEVVSVNPVDGAQQVSPRRYVTLNFSESIHPQTQQNVGVSSNGQILDHSLDWSMDNRTVVIRATLPEQAEITVWATEALEDQAGNPLVPFTSTFRTGLLGDLSQPTIIQSLPYGRMPVDAPVTLIYSQPMDVASLESGIRVLAEDNFVEGDLIFQYNNRVVTFTPHHPLPYNATLQMIVEGALSQTGQAAQSVTIVNFHTEYDPAAGLYYGVEGAVNGAPLNNRLEIRYSQPLDPSTVNPQNVTLDQGAVYTVSLSADQRSILVEPTQPLLAETGYYLRTQNISAVSGEQAPDVNGYFVTGTSEDHQAPVVVKTSPFSQAENAPGTLTLQLEFSEKVNRFSLTDQNVVLKEGSTVLKHTLELGDRHLSITPYGLFSPNGTVTLELQNVTDPAGNALSFAMSFTIRDALDEVKPEILFTTPMDGARDVAVNAAVLAVMNEAIDCFSLQGQVTLRGEAGYVSGTVSLETDGRTIRFQPDGPLPAGQNLWLSLYSIRDLAGNGHFYQQISFTTGFQTDQQAPELETAGPVDGATDVPRNTSVMLRFNEPVLAPDPETVVFTGLDPIPFQVSQYDQGRTLVFRPQHVLEADTAHHFSLTGVTDVSGNASSQVHNLSFTTGRSVDVTPPQVVQWHPEPYSDHAPLNIRLSALLDEPLHPGTPLSGIVLRRYYDPNPVPAQVTTNGRVVTLVPDEPLLPDQDYEFYVGEVMNLSGLLAETVSARFTSGSHMQEDLVAVTAIHPADGGTDVSLNARPGLRVDQPLDPNSLFYGNLSLTSGGVPVPGTPALTEDGLRVRFHPHDPLQANTAYVFSAAGLASQTGAPVPAVEIGFTTGTQTDETPPQALSVDPVDGAQDVDLSATVTLTFSEPLDPTSLTPQYPGLYTNGVLLETSIHLDGAQITLTPMHPLPPNALIEVMTGDELQDPTGSAAAAFTSSFTTGSTPDLEGPVVLTVTPVDGAVDISPSTPITLAFSEPVHPHSVIPETVAILADGQSLPYQVLQSAGGRVLTLTAAIPENSTVQVSVGSGVEDFQGNSAQPFVSAYQTHPDPGESTQVLSQKPSSTDQAPQDAPVILFLSNAVDPATLPGALFITEDGVVKDGQIAVSPDGLVITFTPDQLFAYGALVTAYLTSDARDLSGQRLLSHQGTYQVLGDPSQDAPYIVGTSYTNNIPLNAVMELAASEPLDPATVNEDTITLTQGGTLTSATVELVDQRIIRVTPDLPLDANATYRVSITGSGVFDLHGQSLSWSYASFRTADGVDNEPPIQVLVSPMDGLQDAPLNVVLRIRFHETINRNTANLGNITLTANRSPLDHADISFSNEDRDILIQTFQPLQPNTDYEVSVTGITDLAGVAGAPVSFQFRTTEHLDQTQPLLEYTLPHNYADQVPVNAQIKAVFDESLDPASLEHVTITAGGQPVEGTASLSPNARQIIFTPAQALQPNQTHYVEFRRNINLTGLQSYTQYLRFTTGSDTDETEPEIIEISPPEGWTDIPLNAYIGVVFNEPVDPGSLAGVTLVNPDPVPVTMLIDGGDTLRIRPHRLLEPHTVHTLEINGVRDISGNPMSEATQISFTTGAEPQLTAVELHHFLPEPYQYNIPTNARSVVRFTREIDPATLTEVHFHLRRYSQSNPIPAVLEIHSDYKGATLTPIEPLQTSSTHYAVLTGVRSLNGALLERSQRFTTGNVEDNLNPSVLETTPINDAVDVSVNATLEVTFNEAVAIAGPETGLITLETKGGEAAVHIQWIIGQGLRITPREPMLSGTVYTLTLDGVTDQAGNPLPPFTMSFTTEGATR